MNKVDVPIILFIFGCVLLSAPLLRIFDGVLPFYLFAVWALLIVLLARSGKTHNRRGDD